MSSATAIAHLDNGRREFTIDGSVSSLSSSRVIDSRTTFDLASLTKVIVTTTLIAIALEKRVITLDEKVSRYLSDWKESEKADLDLEDLLRHESGLEEWRPFYISCKTPKEALAKISSTPLKYPKKSEFHYSDLNFMVLGEVVAKIYGADLATLFDHEIAKPLQLSDTSFATPRDSENVVATSDGDAIEREMVRSKVPYPVEEEVENFQGWRTHLLSGEVNDGNSFHLFSGIAGHAGLFSSLSDLTTYLEAIFEGFLSSETLQLFATPRNHGEQGIGFRRYPLTSSSYAIGHTGFTGTGIACDFEAKRGLVYLTNRLHTKEKYPPMAEIWRDDLQKLSQKRS
jgi:CubicO group peptidase (beta-lactamase class C family)